MGVSCPTDFRRGGSRDRSSDQAGVETEQRHAGMLVIAFPLEDGLHCQCHGVGR